ncbi:3'-5' exonuclease [Anoxybacillus sp. LAT_35]|uniref:exonuclease domain-containing protein n=1 Tax=unclassified Anoxybacillus TaxID=2639704 RepID=UPI001EDA2628|nr:MULTISPECIES: exonuclease domain-containing protein [unclassified Anoxybacillus]MCG5026368.1 3'-5' exonuclease [Anoxybacillus flavithermus]MCG6199271.1 3'-5' exonuclease [Anoxybacillus sp. LAT_38]MCG3084367.1 3'-5' exonuclease [Anoxybacillus sp. LAT27]MCG6171037.1 3'-5' exonuclease [Anoxybacillus sp. LAT_11]MCG6176068.1 3'-5' exonuclease [Anoxybacillus sp. LAT_31]
MERPFQWISRILSLGLRYDQATAVGPAFQQEAWIRKIMKEVKKHTYSLETPLSDVTFILLDTETTGFSPQRGDEIFSLAALKTKNGEPLDLYCSNFRPKRRIPEHVEVLTGITNDDVACAPLLEEEIHHILSFLNHGILLGYHIQHDVAFLNEFLSRNYRTVLQQTTIEMRKIMECIYHDSFPTLDDALSFYHLTPIDRHTAKGDVMSLFEMWKRVFIELQQLQIDTLHDLYALLSQCS